MKQIEAQEIQVVFGKEVRFVGYPIGEAPAIGEPVEVYLDGSDFTWCFEAEDVTVTETTGTRDVICRGVSTEEIEIVETGE